MPGPLPKVPRGEPNNRRHPGRGRGRNGEGAKGRRKQREPKLTDMPPNRALRFDIRSQASGLQPDMPREQSRPIRKRRRRESAKIDVDNDPAPKPNPS